MPGPYFAGLPIYPENPARFESQASFLQHLNLLLPGESERLTEADFEPEVISPEPDEEDEPPDKAA